MFNAVIDPVSGTITLTLEEFARLTGTELILIELPVPVVLPDVEVFEGRYTQVFVQADGLRGGYWVCSCNDFRYRRQSPEGITPEQNDFCKHIEAARWTRHRARMQPYATPFATPFGRYEHLLG